MNDAMKVQRFKDFAEYLKGLGYSVKYLNFCNFEFMVSSESVIPAELKDVFEKFGAKYDAVCELDNRSGKLAGGGYYHTVKRSETVDYEIYLAGLGGDGIAMVMGKSAVI